MILPPPAVCRGCDLSRASARVQVALGIIKAAEKHLLAMDDMEEMVEFMKTDVPGWDVQTLQACTVTRRSGADALAAAPCFTHVRSRKGRCIQPRAGVSW